MLYRPVYATLTGTQNQAPNHSGASTPSAKLKHAIVKNTDSNQTSTPPITKTSSLTNIAAVHKNPAQNSQSKSKPTLQSAPSSGKLPVTSITNNKPPLTSSSSRDEQFEMIKMRVDKLEQTAKNSKSEHNSKSSKGHKKKI